MSTYTLISGEDKGISYVGHNLDTWAEITSWDSWTVWNSNPEDVVLQIDDEFDAEDVRAPVIETSHRGSLAVQLKVSNTGTFTGEETTYSFSSTPTTIIAGKYYRWTLTVSASGIEVPVINWAQTRYISTHTQEEYRSIDTSTLGGTVSARTVTHSLGSVSSVQITSVQDTAWVDRAYALPDDFVSPTDVAPIPGVITKNPLTIILRDDFGVPVDGVIDIVIYGAPKVYLTETGVTI